MKAARAVRRRPGVHDLVVTLILVSATIILGLLFGANLQDRVGGYLEVMEGEVLSATAIHRGDTLHVRVDFRHVIGPGFDRVAVSELAAGGSYVERGAGPLHADHALLEYAAGGWGKTGCTGISVDERGWPPAAPPAAPATACTIDVYQRVGDSDPREGVMLSDGGTATLEFVLVGVDRPANTLGASLEFGTAARTAVTNMADVALYAP